MKTVAELFPDIKAQAGTSGSCDVADVMRRMNIIGQELLYAIDAKGTLFTWCIPVCGNCMIMPPDIMQVKQMSLCGRPMTQRSQFWTGRMMGDDYTDGWSSYPWSTVIDTGNLAYTQWFVNAGINEVFAIRAKKQSDVGKEVDVRWRTSTGEDKRVKFSLVGDQELVEIGGPVGEVYRFQKPRTDGAVELWVKNVSTGEARLVARYGPYEEIPEYKIMRMPVRCGQLSIKGKKMWVPLRSEEDIVPFGDVMAWRNALRAEAASVEGKVGDRNAYLEAAIGDLEREKKAFDGENIQRGMDIVSPWSVGAGSSGFGRFGRRAAWSRR